jgi:hypothetical protein
MIEKTELRIGNLVLASGRCNLGVVKITELHEDIAVAECMDGDVDISSMVVRRGPYRSFDKIPPTKALLELIQLNTTALSIEFNNDLYEIYGLRNGAWIFIANAKSMHDLQNLIFSLTGSELTGVEMLIDPNKWEEFKRQNKIDGDLR